MLEALFHWSMLLYYLHADATMLTGLLNAHALRGKEPDDPSTNRIVNGSLTYITIWNMMVQQIYFAICSRDHLMGLGKGGGRKGSRPSRRIVMLRSVLFPTTCVVSTVYWWYYWKSPSLIFGDILAEIYPWWIDHAMHTFIVPIAFFELYLSSTERKEGEGWKLQGWLVFSSFIIFYAVVVTIVRIIRGVWPYPFLDPVNDGDPVMFFLSLYIIGSMWYFVGIHLSNKVWVCRQKIKDKSRRT